MTVLGLSLAWTLSCSESRTANVPDASPVVDAGKAGPDAGPDRPSSPDGGSDRPDIGKDAGPDRPSSPDGGSDRPDIGKDAGPDRPSSPDGGSDRPDIGKDAGAPPDAPPVTRRIAVLADYGGDTSAEALVAALVAAWNPDAVITAGDNNYIAGTFDAYDQVVGKHYHPFIGGYRGKFGAGAPRNRFWPALGDHDWKLGVDAYVDYFALPGKERYYDVDLGPVHLYAINSNSGEPDGYRPTSKQGTWLKDRLASSSSCFDLVYFHHPPYSSGHHGSRTHMDWPFAAWGAEATFAGHDHNYERLEVKGIPYFVVGMGGLGLRAFPGAPLPETKFRDDKSHGAVLITATSDGTITYEFWSTRGVKLDSHTVNKRC